MRSRKHCFDECWGVFHLEDAEEVAEAVAEDKDEMEVDKTYELAHRDNREQGK